MSERNTWECMAGFTLTPVCVAATSGHRVRGMSERGPATNQGLHQIQNKSKYKGNVGSCPWVLHVSFCCFPRLSLVLDTTGRLGGLQGKVGSAYEELQHKKMVYWVNVSESSCAGKRGSSQIRGHLTFVLVVIRGSMSN